MKMKLFCKSTNNVIKRFQYEFDCHSMPFSGQPFSHTNGLILSHFPAYKHIHLEQSISLCDLKVKGHMSLFTTLVSLVGLRETFYLTYMSYTRPRVFFKGHMTLVISVTFYVKAKDESN